MHFRSVVISAASGMLPLTIPAGRFRADRTSSATASWIPLTTGLIFCLGSSMPFSSVAAETFSVIERQPKKHSEKVFKNRNIQKTHPACVRFIFSRFQPDKLLSSAV